MPSSQVRSLSSHTTAKFEWKINNFSKLGASHESEVFSVGSWRWKLKIYPRGDSKTYDKLPIFLVPVDKTKLPYAEFSLVVTSQTHSTINFKGSGKHQFTQEYANGMGWVPYMPLNELHDLSKGYLLQDTCIIQVKITC